MEDGHAHRLPDLRLRCRLGLHRQGPALAGADQTDVSFHWPLATRWNAFGRWNHDWEIGRTIERFAGVEYASCCLAVKLLWHETDDVARNLPAAVRKDRGVSLQIVLRGLAGYGTRIESRLARGIKGYREEEHAL